MHSRFEKNKQHALDPVYSEERRMKRSQKESKGNTEKRDGERKEEQVKEEVADLLCLKVWGEKGEGEGRQEHKAYEMRRRRKEGSGHSVEKVR